MSRGLLNYEVNMSLVCLILPAASINSDYEVQDSGFSHFTFVFSKTNCCCFDPESSLLHLFKPLELASVSYADEIVSVYKAQLG